MALASPPLFDTVAIKRQLNETSQPLTTFKIALELGQQSLIAKHQQHHPITEIVRASSKLVDDLLICAWEALCSECNPSNVSLIAVGGYGRQELNLNSDIDLLILSEQALSAAATTQVESLIQLLWDLNFEVGHSVRTIEECVELASDDVTIFTNLLEARPLCGDVSLNQRLQSRIRDQSIWPNQQFYEAKLNEQNERHQSFDDTAYKLEPNLKSSPGGLRDIQSISWMANRIYGITKLEDAAVEGLLTPGERDVLINQRDLLWQIRNCLHVLSKRSENRILFNYQPEIAEHFGLSTNDEQLAVEQLMQQYYRAAKDIRRLNEFILQQIGDSFNTAPEVVLQCKDPRFIVVNGHLTHKDAHIFEQDPSAMLGIFVVYQHDSNIKDFSAATVRAIRSHHHLIDDTFRENPKNLHTFLSFFTDDHALTRTLRKLDLYGVLGRFLPVYGRIAGQMQHDLFHAYTVDAHSLFVIRNLRRFAQSEFNDEFPELSEVMERTQLRHRVYLAGLFHDIAKGRGGNHDKLGAIDAREYCTKLAMAAEDVELVSWLVLHHLQMSKVSQREDLSDEQVIKSFAERVGNQAYLDNLYLLTVADIRATSPDTWTAWKGHLLSQLYNKTTRYFNNLQDKHVVDNKAKRTRRKRATAALLKDNVNAETLEQYWQMLDDDYVLSHRPATMAWHASQICSASALDMPVVDARYLKEYEAQQYVIYTADSPYVLPAITAAFDELGQTILQAKIHAANPGFTILLFTVSTIVKLTQMPSKKVLSNDATCVRSTLISTNVKTPPKNLWVPRLLKEFEHISKVTISDITEQGNIIIEIEALDEPGLINKISNAFAQCHVRLINASITTVGEKAEDTFMVGHPSKTQSLTRDHKVALDNALNALFGLDKQIAKH